MRTFRKDLEKNLQDPAFRAEWEAFQPEMAAVPAIARARTESGLTQKQPAQRTGIDQAVISKLGTGGTQADSENAAETRSRTWKDSQN